MFLNTQSADLFAKLFCSSTHAVVMHQNDYGACHMPVVWVTDMLL